MSMPALVPFRALPRGALVAALVMALVAGFAPGPARAADAGSSLVDEARVKLRKRDVRGALAALEKAIAADPTNADAHILYQDFGREAVGPEILVTSYRTKAADKPDDPLLAFLYARLLPPEEALKEFDAKIKKFPASPWPHAGKARVLETLGRHAEAGLAYDAALLAAPTQIRFKAYQAYGMERSGHWTAAIDAWKAVLAVAPKDRAALLGLGEAQRQIGSAAEAVTTLSELVKADPTDAEARYRIAIANADEGKLDEALTSIDAALATDRTFVEAYCAGAEISVRRAFETAEKEKRDPVEKDFEKAIAYGAKAAAVGSDRADAHFAYGAAHEAVGEIAQTHYDTAAVEYDAALALLPLPSAEKVRTLCAKAFVLLRLQKWDQALTAAEKALGIDEKCVSAYLHAGFALAAQGRQEEAIKKYYRPGQKYAPDDARLHHAIGTALWETTKDIEAKKELEAAVKADPKNVRYRLTLGQMYYDLKMFKPAGEQLVRVVEARPYDVECWRSYGRVCCALKDWDQAVESYETICKLLEAPAPAAAAPSDTPAAPAPEAAAPMDEDLLKKAHLYLAIIYGDHMKKRDKAKEHAKRFVQLGGVDQNLQSFIDDLISGN